MVSADITIDVNTSGVNDDNQVRLFYKPTNTLTTGYQMVTESMNINDLGSGDVIIHTPVVAISPELFIDSNEATVPVSITANATGIINGRINIDIDGATIAPDGAVTQRLILDVTDSQEYFEGVVTLEGTEDFIQAGFNSTIFEANRIRLAATDNVTQQFLTAIGPRLDADGNALIEIEDLNIAGANIPGVILFANPEGVSIGEIVAAVDASTTGQTVQMTESRVEAVERATGYMVGNGGTGAAGRTGTRLNGIKPKSGDFDPTQDYETVL